MQESLLEFLKTWLPNLMKRLPEFWKATCDTLLMEVWAGSICFALGLVFGIILTVTKPGGIMENRPVYQTLLAFRQKGWAVEEEGRWHFTVPGFLISNTLIGILLEAQAGGRIEGTPWLSEAYEAEEKISIPKSEEEMFTELYQQQTGSEDQL